MEQGILKYSPEVVGPSPAEWRRLDQDKGVGRLLINNVGLQQGQGCLDLSSPAFTDLSVLPELFTADGEGVSPALRWSNVPAATRNMALIVEDADSPSSEPLVHAIAVDLDPRLDGLPEGALSQGPMSARNQFGRSSYLRRAWVPPDPPPGEGRHRYVFQLFALLPGEEFSDPPGRSELVVAIHRRGIASGMLTATYEH